MRMGTPVPVGTRGSLSGGGRLRSGRTTFRPAGSASGSQHLLEGLTADPLYNGGGETWRYIAVAVLQAGWPEQLTVRFVSS